MYFKTSLNVFQELIRYLAQSGSNASGLVKALSVLSVQAQVSELLVAAIPHRQPPRGHHAVRTHVDLFCCCEVSCL